MTEPVAPGSRRPGRLRRWAINLAIIAASLLVAFAVVEVLVRNFIDVGVQPRFVVDPGYGVRGNQPNIVTRHYGPGEFEVTISTNGAGLRGARDYALANPGPVYRVALLGDSFVVGHGVNDDEVVSFALEALFAEQFGADRYQVLNFGVSGFGTAQELVTYTHKARAYAPDAVVTFYFGNDPGNIVVSGLYALDQSGRAVRTESDYLPGVELREILYAIPPVRWLFEHSQAWSLVRNRLSSLVHKRLLRENNLESYQTESETAVALTKAVIVKLIETVKADGALPVLFIIPGRDLESNFPFSAAEVEALGATLVDGRAFLTADDYWVRDQHWRAGGHAKAAEVLRDLLAPPTLP